MNESTENPFTITDEKLLNLEIDALKFIASNLIEAHAGKASTFIDESKFKLSVSLVIDRSYFPSVVKGKVSYAQRCTGEAELKVENPNQPSLL